MALTDISPFNEVDFVTFCVDPAENFDARPCCGALFIAPMLDGKAVDGEVKLIATYDQALELYGAGSVAAEMARYYLLNNPFGEMYIAGLADLGTKAFTTLTFDRIDTSTGATSNGSYNVVIGGTTYNIPVATGDLPNEIAQDLVDAINNDMDALVTATNPSFGVVRIEAKNGGEQGNYITIFNNVQFGQEAPENITLEFDPMSGGAGTYDIEPVLDEYCNCCYDFIGVPFGDVVTLGQLEAFSSLRHECDKLLFGRWYTTRFASFSDHIDFLDNTEYKYGTVWTECTSELYTPWAQTAAAVGRAHQITCADPAIDWRFGNLNGIPCTNVKCGEDCFTRAERNLLVQNGGSTTFCSGSEKQLEVTVGAGEYSFESYYKYPQTDYTTSRFINNFKTFIFDNFTGVKIVNNIGDSPTGANVVDVPTILSLLATWLRDTQGDIIDDVEAVIRSINVERDPVNPSRINISICASVIAALRKFAIQVSPKLGARRT